MTKYNPHKHTPYIDYRSYDIGCYTCKQRQPWPETWRTVAHGRHLAYNQCIYPKISVNLTTRAVEWPKA